MRRSRRCCGPRSVPPTCMRRWAGPGRKPLILRPLPEERAKRINGSGGSIRRREHRPRPVGYVLRRHGYDVTFVDVVDEVVAPLNALGRYPVRTLARDG